MYKKSTFLILLILATKLVAQIPEKISYQAIIRDSQNILVSNQTIGIKLSILQGTITGNIVYTEYHSLNTNINGLLTLNIGTGISSSSSFNAIAWDNGPYFIKTEMDLTNTNNYTITTTSELLSVPYALHAKTANRLSAPIVENDPVFNTSPASSITENDKLNWDNHITEVDGSITNEIQELSISNDTISLNRSGGFVKLPNAIPTGSIMLWSSSTPPNGWMICDGRSLNKTNYAKLYNVINTLYGGNATTFKLPNLQERVPVGVSAQTQYTLGSQGGSISSTPNISVNGHVLDHTLTISQIPSHNHHNGQFKYLLKLDGTRTITGATDDTYGEPNLGTTAALASQGNGQAHNHGFQSTASSSPVSTIQPYLALYYIIKY